MSDEQELPRVKLIPLQATWTCPNCHHHNGISAAKMDDKTAQCTACAQWVRPGVDRSVPSGQREVWDEAIEIVRRRSDQLTAQATYESSPLIRAALEGRTYCIEGIIAELETARDAAPASIGYDQRTIVAASKACETYADERYAMTPQSEAGTSQHWHHVGEYDAARVCATRIRSLATTPVHEGGK